VEKVDGGEGSRSHTGTHVQDGELSAAKDGPHQIFGAARQSRFHKGIVELKEVAGKKTPQFPGDVSLRSYPAGVRISGRVRVAVGSRPETRIEVGHGFGVTR
jgi:hypothetical protein